MTWSWVDTIYKHTPSTAYMQDCLFFLYSHDHKLTPEYSFSFRCASLHAQLPSGTSPWERKDAVTLSYSHVCVSTNCRIKPPQPARCPSTASKYSSNLAWWRPPERITKVKWLHLEVYLQTCSITISECITKFPCSWPPSVFPNFLDYILQVHV